MTAQKSAVLKIREALVALENAYIQIEGACPQQVLEHLQNAFKEGHDALALLPA